MKISIAADHRGVKYKSAIIDKLKQQGIEVINKGTDTEESVDYPDYACAAAKDVSSGTSDYGIIVCGSGIGVDIVANKVKGVRSVNAVNEEMAKLSRQHNNANVLCIGQDLIDEKTALNIVEVFLNSEFEGGRHQKRIDKIEGMSCC